MLLVSLNYKLTLARCSVSAAFRSMPNNYDKGGGSPPFLYVKMTPTT